jgi:hypothetical protein
MLAINLIRDVINEMCYCDKCRPLVRMPREAPPS